MSKNPVALAFAACICAFTACTSSAPPPKTDKWEVTEGAAYKDNSPWISLRLNAEPESTASLEQEKTPTLHILCNDGTTSFSVWAGEKQGESFDLSYHTMWIQFDDRAVFFEENWSQAMPGDSVESPRAIRFIQQVAGAKRLTLKYTSLSQVVLRFDVRGLNTYLPKVAEDCGWKMGIPTGAPKLTEIRKVFLKSYDLEEDAERMMEEWRQKVQGHTCLQAVPKLKVADAILRLDSDDTVLTSKDDETLWSQKMGYLEYKPLNRAVGCPALAKSEARSESFSIRASRSEGKALVYSWPQAATVSIDANELGQTPLTVPLDPGRHLIEIAKYGYITWKSHIVVQADRTEHIEVTLQEADGGDASKD